MRWREREASHFEMGALWYPGPECDYLGFDGPVGAERMDKWRDDVMICPRAVFADLWNVSPFVACGLAPFSVRLPCVWGLEPTSSGDPLDHKWLIAAFEARAEPLKSGAPSWPTNTFSFCWRARFDSQWCLDEMNAALADKEWNSTCCVFISRNLPRW